MQDARSPGLRRLPLRTLDSKLCTHMIRPLRQRHRVMVLALTATLPVAFAFGIATRREVPATRAATAGPFAEARNQGELWTRDDLWEKKAIKTRLLSVGPGTGHLAIELVSMDRIVLPDLLVYWVPGEPRIENSLPDNAFLLGSFEQSSLAPLALPDPAKKQTGALVLYSLADHEVAALSKAFTAGK